MAHLSKSSTKSPGREVKSPFLQAQKQVKRTNSLDLVFSRLASRTAQVIGHPLVFLTALVIVVVWGALGPVFRYSDTWQLVINTGTTIITFLVVFLIQNTQNRDAKALHLKLDELIRSTQQAHNEMIDIEKLSDEEVASVNASLARSAAQLRVKRRPRS